MGWGKFIKKFLRFEKKNFGIRDGLFEFLNSFFFFFFFFFSYFLLFISYEVFLRALIYVEFFGFSPDLPFLKEN